MKIILEGEDITKAMVTYVSSMGVDLTDKDVTTSIFAGRSTNTNTITLDIQSQKEVITTSVPKPTVVEVEEAIEEADPDTTEDAKEEEPSDKVNLFANA